MKFICLMKMTRLSKSQFSDLIHTITKLFTFSVEETNYCVPRPEQPQLGLSHSFKRRVNLFGRLGGFELIAQALEDKANGLSSLKESGSFFLCAVITFIIDILPKKWVQRNVPKIHASYRKFINNLKLDHPISDEAYSVECLITGVEELYYLKRDISNKKIAKDETYRDLKELF